MKESKVLYDKLQGEFWLTRIVFVKWLSVLYFVAFSVALFQNEGLLGDKGLTPAISYIKRYHGHFNNTHHHNMTTAMDWQENLFHDKPWTEEAAHHRIGFMHHPTVFWFLPPSTTYLYICAACGMLISALIFMMGSANSVLYAVLWLLYFSIVNVGQTWYSFGWESQLLETGLLAVFMVPVVNCFTRFPTYTPAPYSVVVLYRWLLFRIMIGAGMIKIRGDECWRDLTCMHYHYQTQPVPNPISMYFHYNHDLFHRFETLSNHIIELVCPWMLLIPHRKTLLIGGIIQVMFQFVLISSGNLAFLNWLTAIPAIWCTDDAFWAWTGIFSERDVQYAVEAAENYKEAVARMSKKSDVDIDAKHKKDDDAVATNDVEVKGKKTLTFVEHYLTYSLSWPSLVILTRRLLAIALTAYIGYLSYPVINNIMSPTQAMNISFDPFRVVNSYGAFGSITKVRHEVIIQGTKDDSLGRFTKWEDFEFTCKPGDINRRPCIISPYHYRIDWLMWFAAFQNYQQCPWIVHLADKLLNGDPVANMLLAFDGNPFYNGTTYSKVNVKNAPKFIRAQLYEYQYPSLTASGRAAEAAEGWEVGTWWKRRFVREYMPALEKNNPSVRDFLRSHAMK